MKQTSRIEAQQRADDIRVFRKELERLEAEGVLKLADGQRAAVRAHHDGLLAGFAQAFDIDRDVRAKQLSWGMRIASLLGAVASAASVFFLFYQFWGRFTETAQVDILIGASLGMFAITVWIRAAMRPAISPSSRRWRPLRASCSTRRCWGRYSF